MHFRQNFNTTKLLGRTEQYPIRVPLDESEFDNTSGESESEDRAVNHQKPTMSAKGQSWLDPKKKNVFLFSK